MNTSQEVHIGFPDQLAACPEHEHPWETYVGGDLDEYNFDDDEEPELLDAHVLVGSVHRVPGRKNMGGS